MTGGKPGQLRVGHTLGDEDGGKYHAGDEVGAKVTPFIGAGNGVNPGDHGLDPGADVVSASPSFMWAWTSPWLVR